MVKRLWLAQHVHVNEMSMGKLERDVLGWAQVSTMKPIKIAAIAAPSAFEPTFQ